MWVTFTQTKQSGVLSAANIYGHVSLGRDCLDEFLWSFIPHFGFKRVISRVCPHVLCLKVEAVYPWALSRGHNELFLDHSCHSMLTFPGLNVCCKLLLKPFDYKMIKRHLLKHLFTTNWTFCHFLLTFMLFQPSIIFLCGIFFNAKGQKRIKVIHIIYFPSQTKWTDQNVWHSQKSSHLL